jgi:hypothetical protein
VEPPDHHVEELKGPAGQGVDRLRIGRRWEDRAEMFSEQSGRSRPVNATGWSSRYASPRTLADDVERWIADEPVTAYSEPFTRRARRWAKKQVHPGEASAGLEKGGHADSIVLQRQVVPT